MNRTPHWPKPNTMTLLIPLLLCGLSVVQAGKLQYKQVDSSVNFAGKVTNLMKDMVPPSITDFFGDPPSFADLYDSGDVESEKADSINGNPIFLLVAVILVPIFIVICIVFCCSQCCMKRCIKESRKTTKVVFFVMTSLAVAFFIISIVLAHVGNKQLSNIYGTLSKDLITPLSNVMSSEPPLQNEANNLAETMGDITTKLNEGVNILGVNMNAKVVEEGAELIYGMIGEEFNKAISDVNEIITLTDDLDPPVPALKEMDIMDHLPANIVEGDGKMTQESTAAFLSTNLGPIITEVTNGLDIGSMIPSINPNDISEMVNSIAHTDVLGMELLDLLNILKDKNAILDYLEESVIPTDAGYKGIVMSVAGNPPMYLTLIWSVLILIFLIPAIVALGCRGSKSSCCMQCSSSTFGICSNICMFLCGGISVVLFLISGIFLAFMYGDSQTNSEALGPTLTGMLPINDFSIAGIAEVFIGGFMSGAADPNGPLGPIFKALNINETMAQTMTSDIAHNIVNLLTCQDSSILKTVQLTANLNSVIGELDLNQMLNAFLVTEGGSGKWTDGIISAEDIDIPMSGISDMNNIISGAMNDMVGKIEESIGEVCNAMGDSIIVDGQQLCGIPYNYTKIDEIIIVCENIANDPPTPASTPCEKALGMRSYSTSIDGLIEATGNLSDSINKLTQKLDINQLVGKIKDLVYDIVGRESSTFSDTLIEVVSMVDGMLILQCGWIGDMYLPLEKMVLNNLTAFPAHHTEADLFLFMGAVIAIIAAMVGFWAFGGDEKKKKKDKKGKKGKKNKKDKKGKKRHGSSDEYLSGDDHIVAVDAHIEPSY